jgi:hypothetical protein
MASLVHRAICRRYSAAASARTKPTILSPKVPNENRVPSWQNQIFYTGLREPL